MTSRPSIESLRETLYEIIPPSDPESEHPGRFSDLLAALDELEAYRQMPTLEAAAIARAEKAEAARDQWKRYAEDQRQGWNAAMVSVQTAQTILEMLVDGEEVKDEARRWLKGSAHTDLEAHDTRVRREALEGAWERVSEWQWLRWNEGPPVVDEEALQLAILGPESQPNEQETK